MPKSQSKETDVSLSKIEIAEMVAEAATVHTCRNQIKKLSKIVYGSSGTLNAKMVEILKHPNVGDQLAEEIRKNPYAIANLAGVDLICFKSQARAKAEEHVMLLGCAVENFTDAVRQARQEIAQELQAEQKAKQITGARDLEKIFIPKEELAPLTKSEMAEMIAEDACVHTSFKQVKKYAKTVYGSSGILNEKMVEILKNPSVGDQIAKQIEQAPYSISSLAGVDFICFKSQARANAEEHVLQLGCAVANYAHAVRYAKKEITQEHQAEQARRGKAVKMPSKGLQDLFSLSPEQKREALANSPLLQKELCNFVQEVNSRLSSSEQRALKNSDHETLAKSLGISEHKAKEITEITKHAREAHQQAQALTVSRSKVLAMAS
ncbi:replicative DNA helicase [Bartonella callosciuri]|uniref:Replicative DNA helicase n=1 Tax=Bartonella callosciuri TaxID=686223 RepID=A0A840NVN3_9HYPH|nr:BID domain-containing T4SS effector [Bartonella callosciuri]MBB5073983.1 replicative DNA helicase [Bartonella callosciuri]